MVLQEFFDGGLLGDVAGKGGADFVVEVNEFCPKGMGEEFLIPEAGSDVEVWVD